MSVLFKIFLILSSKCENLFNFRILFESRNSFKLLMRCVWRLIAIVVKNFSLMQEWVDLQSDSFSCWVWFTNYWKEQEIWIETKLIAAGISLPLKKISNKNHLKLTDSIVVIQLPQLKMNSVHPCFTNVYDSKWNANNLCSVWRPKNFFWEISTWNNSKSKIMFRRQHNV